MTSTTAPLPISVNQMTLQDLALDDAINAVARAGFQGFTPWADRIMDFGAERSRKLFCDAQIHVSGFCLAGLFSNQGLDRKSETLNQAKSVIDLAKSFGAPNTIFVSGGLLPGSKSRTDAIEFCFDCLTETAEYARSVGMPLVIEALHPMYTPDWSVVNRLAMAIDWAEKCGLGVGVAVDTYHVWWDPDLASLIQRAGASGLLQALHFSDWLVPTNDLLMDRGIPGLGVIDFQMILDNARAHYYSWIEVEIFSEAYKSKDTHEYLCEIHDAMAAILDAK